MIHSGFFSQQNHDLENELEAKYVLTDASVLLLKNHPMSVTPFLHAMLDPVLTNPWNQFSTWFKNGDPTPFETAHGKMFWDYAGADPKLNHLFNDAMASDARFVTSLVIEKCKGVFMGLESLVDKLERLLNLRIPTEGIKPCIVVEKCLSIARSYIGQPTIGQRSRHR